MRYMLLTLISFIILLYSLYTLVYDYSYIVIVNEYKSYTALRYDAPCWLTLVISLSLVSTIAFGIITAANYISECEHKDIN